MKDETAQYERRCPRLGSPVFFPYCMSSGDDEKPCFKVADCWWETFDVVGYLKQHLSEQTFREIRDARPKPKVLSILELIQQAKNNAGK